MLIEKQWYGLFEKVLGFFVGWVRRKLLIVFPLIFFSSCETTEHLFTVNLIFE